jgi:Trypsin
MKTRLLLGSALLAMSCANEPEYFPSEVQPIVNGEQVEATDRRFDAVGLIFFGGSLCTGTLLDVSDVPGTGPEDVGVWVLTASHCTIESRASDTTFHIGNGNPDGFSLSAPFFTQSLQAKKLFTHPIFISQGGLPQFFRGNDIALLQLEEPVVGIEGIPFNRVKLEDITTPSNNANQETDCDITKNCFTVVGFGDTIGGGGDAGSKRVANIIIEGLSPEHVEFGNFNHGGNGPNGNGSSNTCQGDSGGPSFMEIDGKLRIIAVTSGGAGGCLGDSFSQRTDSDFEEFLDKIIDGGLVPQEPGCVADNICDEACGITDPDCTCRADGFCQPPSQCRGVNDIDPDCSNGNNAEDVESCSVTPASSTTPLGLSVGLLALAFASLGLRRRKS